jgi:hypothetical protein
MGWVGMGMQHCPPSISDILRSGAGQDSGGHCRGVMTGLLRGDERMGGREVHALCGLVDVDEESTRLG